jgi:hypothetical protein
MERVDVGELFSDLNENVKNIVDWKTGSFDEFDEELVERSREADKKIKESFNKLMNYYGIKMDFNEDYFVKTGYYEGESRGIVELLAENPKKESIQNILKSVKKLLDGASKNKYGRKGDYYNVDFNREELKNVLKDKLETFNWIINDDEIPVDLQKSILDTIKRENPDNTRWGVWGNYIQTFTKGIDITDIKFISKQTKSLFNVAKINLKPDVIKTLWEQIDPEDIEYYDNKTILFSDIKKAIAVTSIITTIFDTININSTDTKQNALNSEPDPNKVNGEDLFYAILYDWYMEATAGCYMADNSGIYLLNNCSNYYNTDDNKKNCVCGELSDTLEKSKCDTPDECLKPYCLGKCQGSDSKKQCSNNKNRELYKCTNKGSIADPNFVKYFYYNNFFMSILPYYGTVSENYRNLLLEKNQTPKSDIYKYIIVGILVIIILGLIIFLYFRIIKNKKSRNLKKKN